MLRNPDVLAAIAGAGRGEASNVPFTLPVPVERHFQAYAARIECDAPPVTVLLLHDLTRVESAVSRCAPTLSPMPATNCARRWRRSPASSRPCAAMPRMTPPAREQFLEIMAAEAGRMRRLINDLLSLTRIEITSM